jgi:enoyl-CoA hydratase/carnithine racemase
MSRVRVEIDGSVKTVILNRPEKRNAMDAAMLDALYDVFTATPDENDRVIVVRGEGPSFCAGIDLAERQRNPSTGSESPVERVFHAMEMNPLPIVAIVQGAAIAGGCEMALHCEFVVAAETARFGMSLAQIGLAPTWFLTKKLMEVAGPVATREILLLGEPMSARWMADHGVICRVVPENQLNAEAQKIIERLATNAPLSLRAMKALIVRELAFRDGIAHVDIDTMVGATRGSNDAKEGIAARLEKRPPVFTGS